MVENNKNIFISHIHEDDHRLDPLKTLLGISGMQVRDASINSANPNNANDENYINIEFLSPA